MLFTRGGKVLVGRATGLIRLDLESDDAEVQMVVKLKPKIDSLMNQ